MAYSIEISADLYGTFVLALEIVDPDTDEPIRLGEVEHQFFVTPYDSDPCCGPGYPVASNSNGKIVSDDDGVLTITLQPSDFQVCCGWLCPGSLFRFVLLATATAPASGPNEIASGIISFGT